MYQNFMTSQHVKHSTKLTKHDHDGLLNQKTKTTRKVLNSIFYCISMIFQTIFQV